MVPIVVYVSAFIDANGRKILSVIHQQKPLRSLRFLCSRQGEPSTFIHERPFGSNCFSAPSFWNIVRQVTADCSAEELAGWYT